MMVHQGRLRIQVYFEPNIACTGDTSPTKQIPINPLLNQNSDALQELLKQWDRKRVYVVESENGLLIANMEC